jgi:hypothetical protein
MGSPRTGKICSRTLRQRRTHLADVQSSLSSFASSLKRSTLRSQLSGDAYYFANLLTLPGYKRVLAETQQRFINAVNTKEMTYHHTVDGVRVMYHREPESTCFDVKTSTVIEASAEVQYYRSSYWIRTLLLACLLRAVS